MLAWLRWPCSHDRAVKTRTSTCFVAALLFSSVASAQGGRVVGADMPVASANPPQGSIAVMPPQQQGVTSRTVAASVQEPRRPEDYGGVAPGSRQIPPGMRRLATRRNAGAVVAWPGFQMLPNRGSRVFIVSTAGTNIVEGPRAPGVRTYLFPGARLFLHNNSRSLETVSFATPLLRARLRSLRGSVSLVLELRADVNPVLSQEAAATGLVFHYLDLPPFVLNEVARVRLPNGVEISATPQGAVVAPPAPAGPVVDNERPPPVMR